VPKRKIYRIALLICMGAVAVCVALSLNTPRDWQRFDSLPPRDIKPLSERVDKKFRALAKRIEHGEAFELRLTDDELNAYLLTKLRGQELPADIRGVRVCFHEGSATIMVSLDATIARLTLAVDVSVILYDDGCLSLKINGVRLGELPVPRSVFVAVARSLTSGLEIEDIIAGKKFDPEEFTIVPIWMEEFRILDGELYFKGRVE